MAAGLGGDSQTSAIGLAVPRESHQPERVPEFSCWGEGHPTWATLLGFCQAHAVASRVVLMDLPGSSCLAQPPTGTMQGQGAD